MMATKNDIPAPGPDIRSLLAQLRRRIRMYVWVEGISLALLWLGLTFWIGLAIDYLPVLVGASEMPRAARAVLLVIIGLVLAYLLYSWVFRRVLARMPDHSMALLLERHFHQFHDGLVTSVELSEHPDHATDFNTDMLALTARKAESLTSDIQVGGVFRMTPLISKMLLALAVIVPIGLLYAVRAEAVEIWVNRLYLLKDQPWPRSTHLTVLGVQIQHTDPATGTLTLSKQIPFDDNRQLKVAKGTSLLIKVRADAAKTIPEYCTIYYHTADGEAGKVTMPKLGHIRNDQQLYVFDGKPFRGILSSITFDVRGHDHRVRNYRLSVVPSPAIIATQLECTFPKYMVNESLSLWMPRTVDLTSGTQLPDGTHVTIRAKSNKDLVRVDVHNPDTGETTTLNVSDQSDRPREFTFVVPRLEGQTVLEWTLHDTDGVTNDPPHRISILGIQDQPPTVNVTLDGIGTAITPDAVLPTIGKIEDDYDVEKAWFEVALNDSQPRSFPLKTGKNGQVDARLDFRTIRSADNGLALKPKDKLALTIKASDRCDLNKTPNIGIGDQFQLDVVTSDQLLALLERRELGLRRRFEQIIDEVGQMRDSLARIRRNVTNPLGIDPEDTRNKEKADNKTEKKPDPTAGKADSKQPAPAADAETQAASDDAAQRAESLRLLHTQRAIVQADKSAQEVLGVAESFDDIRHELINNRIDTEDRKLRLKNQIAEPLKLVAGIMFPELKRRLEDLEANLADAETSDQAVDLAAQQSDDILLEMDQILQKMLELETYNELVNILRSLMEEQDQLMEATKKERVKQARDLLK